MLSFNLFTSLRNSCRSVTAPVAGGADTLTQALRALDSENVRLQDVGLRRPTLDDVFLSLTGHKASNGNTNGNGNGQKVDIKEAA